MNPCAQKLDLYLTQRAALINYATSVVGCRNQAERLVQEAWLRFGAQAGETRLSGLLRIVRNLAHAQARRPLRPVVVAQRPQPAPRWMQRLAGALLGLAPAV
ncbi:ECF family RNA polymerase sigma factor [Pseudomonas sp. M47T1]|uniref:ECF family RNA polymerase sigma factor n=1 Tax=Pseudomonas sp. M47T1 TaxID=1179778 RepID=UPI000260728A|nr:ECF family RNA polymerase sigma factor [Pseudomonas sp. M47T1]EIK95731.1 ECF family RNA polymerase sigma factor [Pseudomonas sp. M47T1]